MVTTNHIDQMLELRGCTDYRTGTQEYLPSPGPRTKVTSVPSLSLEHSLTSLPSDDSQAHGFTHSLKHGVAYSNRSSSWEKKKKRTSFHFTKLTRGRPFLPGLPVLRTIQYCPAHCAIVFLYEVIRMDDEARSEHGSTQEAAMQF
jgi:hypothetical protein